MHLSSPFGSRARFRDAAAAPRYANALGDLVWRGVYSIRGKVELDHVYCKENTRHFGNPRKLKLLRGQD